jgi:hypothetical protein
MREVDNDKSAAVLTCAFILIVALGIAIISTSYRVADLIIRIEALEKGKK